MQRVDVIQDEGHTKLLRRPGLLNRPDRNYFSLQRPQSLNSLVELHPGGVRLRSCLLRRRGDVPAGVGGKERRLMSAQHGQTQAKCQHSKHRGRRQKRVTQRSSRFQSRRCPNPRTLCPNCPIWKRLSLLSDDSFVTGSELFLVLLSRPLCQSTGKPHHQAMVPIQEIHTSAFSVITTRSIELCLPDIP